ncbi:uncharacterized protein ZK673.1-like [Saccostrea cucullata]|uniref:uncharacterized protein ZK673.1-like n=1 Tax=Saccostrea cuccullata TaxID=36930 RepID=UPI002ED36A56
MEKLFELTIGIFGLLCCLQFGSTDFTDVDWCKDNPDLNCWRYVDKKCVGFYEDWARQNCPFRCGYCPTHPPCVDTDTSCDAYHAEACADENTRAYMREHCRKRCHLCHYPGQDSQPNTPPPGTPVPTDTMVKPAVGK